VKKLASKSTFYQLGTVIAAETRLLSGMAVRATTRCLCVDGGTKESDQALVDHIKKYYGTSCVDYVVNSHPDADHASGLSVPASWQTSPAHVDLFCLQLENL